MRTGSPIAQVTVLGWTGVSEGPAASLKQAWPPQRTPYTTIGGSTWSTQLKREHEKRVEGRGRIPGTCAALRLCWDVRAALDDCGP